MVNYTLETVYDYLAEKNVILIGNAASILFKRHAIDSYDVICRIDDAFPFKSTDVVFEKSDHKAIAKKCYDNVDIPAALGTRTDILFLSPTGINDKWFDTVVKPRYAVRTRKSLVQGVSHQIEEKSLYWCEEGWEELGKTLNFHPTTGCLSFYFLLQSRFKTLTLYGFDFYRSTNFWGMKSGGTHEPWKEERWFIKQIEHHKINFINSEL